MSGFVAKGDPCLIPGFHQLPWLKWFKGAGHQTPAPLVGDYYARRLDLTGLRWMRCGIDRY